MQFLYEKRVILSMYIKIVACYIQELVLFRFFLNKDSVVKVFS